MTLLDSIISSYSLRILLGRRCLLADWELTKPISISPCPRATSLRSTEHIFANRHELTMLLYAMSAAYVCILMHMVFCSGQKHFRLPTTTINQVCLVAFQTQSALAFHRRTSLIYGYKHNAWCRAHISSRGLTLARRFNKHANKHH